MARSHRHNDDDDPFDENGLLRDGKTGRVHMMMRDSQTLHDGRGGAPGRRPGFVFNRDEYARDEAEIAHHEHRHYLENAWRGGQRDSSAVADAEGHSEGAEGDSNVSAGDASSPQEREYRLYDERVKNEWRRPPR